MKRRHFEAAEWRIYGVQVYVWIASLKTREVRFGRKTRGHQRRLRHLLIQRWYPKNSQNRMEDGILIVELLHGHSALRKWACDDAYRSMSINVIKSVSIALVKIK